MFRYFCNRNRHKDSYMDKKLMDLKNSLRFRRWSRKAYSVLISLGKHVTIGHVCKSITEASCLKSSAKLLTYNYKVSDTERLNSGNNISQVNIPNIKCLSKQLIKKTTNASSLYEVYIYSLIQRKNININVITDSDIV